MPCITVRYQKCGKESCSCKQGVMHGPYFWLITFTKKDGEKGKYKWDYLGKDPKSALVKLRESVKDTPLTVSQLKEKGDKAKLKAVGKLKASEKKPVSIKVI